ncbi:MAG: NERD domain-containing protein [Pseudomonadota bacterium]
MDASLLFNEAIHRFWWLMPMALLVGLVNSPGFKGCVGEALVRVIARFRLPAGKYHRIHNVTLPTPDGTTQIDHVIVSRYGIFVIETKHMKGWIFGGEHQSRWTQKFHRQSFPFQNPLRQNHKHVKALEALLELPADVIRSVVVFTGGSTFKTRMPANITVGGGYVDYIRSFHDEVLTEAQVQEALAGICSGRLAPTRQTHRDHVARLKARSDPNAQRHCPKCVSEMVLRMARRGDSAGRQFWGCTSYPKCRMVQEVA